MTSNAVKKRTDEFRQRLANMLEALRAELGNERTTEAGERFRDLAGDVTDAADEASSSGLVESENDQIGRIVAEIRDTEGALARIDAGRYGECVDCGEPIDLARLEAQPTAQRCIACQEQFERARPGLG